MSSSIRLAALPAAKGPPFGLGSLDVTQFSTLNSLRHDYEENY